MSTEKDGEMIKYTCDKCGANLPIDPLLPNLGIGQLVHRRRPVQGDKVITTIAWDFCGPCWDIVRGQLGAGRENNIPRFDSKFRNYA